MADLGLDAHLNFDQLGVKDDSDDEEKGEEIGKKDANLIHIRVQQRNGRKCITTIQGLADELDIKRICKAFKKNWAEVAEGPVMFGSFLDLSARISDIRVSEHGGSLQNERGC